MKIKIIVIGKTGKNFLEEGEREYLQRLRHYIKLDILELADIKNVKNKSIEQIKQEEGQLLLKSIEKGSPVILLDEKGKELSSIKFSKWLQNKMNSGHKMITFVVGGAYGFSEEVYSVATEKLSLSQMTFSHQMIRMLFYEQLYRAFTILRNEPYHHD